MANALQDGSGWFDAYSGRLFRQQADGGEVLKEFMRNAAPLPEILRAVIGNEHFAIAVLPYENFKWKIHCARRSRQHYGSASLGTAKDEQFGQSHCHADSFGLVTVIDEGKQSHPLPCEEILAPIHSFVHRQATA